MARRFRARAVFLPILFAALALSFCARAEGAFIAVGDAAGQVGLLRRLDDWPLFELRYTATYSLEDLYGLVSAQAATPAFACTCLAATDADGHRVMGRNFDWDRHPILVLRTDPAEGYASISVVDLHYLGYGSESDPAASPAGLRAAFEIPFDGMNEAGFAVGMMSVSHAEGIAPRDGREEGSAATRGVVDELGIIRLLLDGAADVEEALGIMEGVDVRFGNVPIHYFLADRGGGSAVVEYLDGKPVVLRSESAWQVSTNFIFAETPRGRWAASCHRYALVSGRLAASGGELADEGALGLLAEVAQASTIWSSSWDLTEGRLALAVGGDFRKRFGFAFSAPPRRRTSRGPSFGRRPARAWAQSRLLRSGSPEQRRRNPAPS